MMMMMMGPLRGLYAIYSFQVYWRHARDRSSRSQAVCQDKLRQAPVVAVTRSALQSSYTDPSATTFPLYIHAPLAWAAYSPPHTLPQSHCSNPWLSPFPFEWRLYVGAHAIRGTWEPKVCFLWAKHQRSNHYPRVVYDDNIDHLQSPPRPTACVITQNTNLPIHLNK